MTNQKTSIKAALATAESRYSPVYKFLPQPNGWGYNSWSAPHNAWWQPQIGKSHTQAVRDRAWSIAAEAARILLKEQGTEEEDLITLDLYAEDGQAGLSPHQRVHWLMKKASD